MSTLYRSSRVSLSGEEELLSCLRKEPQDRSEEEVDVIVSQLQTLKVFESYSEDFLHDLARLAHYEEPVQNVTLFYPGDEGLYWYIVISGSLEMFQSRNMDKTNSICSLGEGSTFGESVLFGYKRQTMIVTTDQCQLLCVESQDMKKLYGSHGDTLKELLPSSRPVSMSGEEAADGSDSLTDPAEVYPEGELPLSEPVDAMPETELTVAGVMLYQLISEHFLELFVDQKVNLYTYKNCCSGKKLVDWVIGQSSVTRSRQQVIAMWQALLVDGVIKHVLNEHEFKDDAQVLYQFVSRPMPEFTRLLPTRPSSPSISSLSSLSSLDTRTRAQSSDSSIACSPTVARDVRIHARPSSISEVSSPSSSPRSSVASLLEECFDVISQFGQEALIFSTLMKLPKDRTAEDIQLIYDELLHVKAFGHLSNAIKQELAAVVFFENHPVAGKFLFREGDTGTSWYIILRGSVNIYLAGKGVVCTLQEGDDFGRLALLNNSPRTVSIMLRENHCCFLRVEREEYKRILLSVERNTVKIKELGKEAMLLERSSVGRYLVVTGMPHTMLDYLVLYELDVGFDESFAKDFFLTYPAFMSTSDLCDGLMKRYANTSYYPSPLSSATTPTSPTITNEERPTATEEQLVSRKRRVVQSVKVWVEMAKADLVKDPAFHQLLKQLQDALVKDHLEDEVDMLNRKLMDSMRRGSTNSDNGKHSHFSSSRKTSEIRIELGIVTVPPCQPSDSVTLRVHTVDKQCCRLHTRLDTKVMDIIQESCKKLELDPAKLDLCEVKSSGEKVVFKERDLSISTEMSVNGRLYVVPKDSTKPLPALPDQNQRPAVPMPEAESSREIASHLTIYDWNLFSNIQVMEFIYQVFGRHRFNKITSNLDLLVRRFNEIQYWVVTEVCNEPNLQRRVKILMKFIKIASHCKSFNNLNSFFAIVLGLSNGAVSRLKQTWEKIPSKLRRWFDQYEALMDPARNHRVLRAYQSKLQPPIIPFMPLVVKDTFFLHEGNETFVSGLVNFEKMRMVASNVQDLSAFRSGILSAEVRALANKNTGIQKYIRDLKVIDNQQTLLQMSYAVEPSKRNRTVSSSS